MSKYKDSDYLKMEEALNSVGFSFDGDELKVKASGVSLTTGDITVDMSETNAAIASTNALEVTQIGLLNDSLDKLDIAIAGIGLVKDEIEASNTELALIKAGTNKIPPLGQALAAASVPVVLTASQLSTLTPPVMTGFATDAKLDTIITTLGTLNTAAYAKKKVVSAKADGTGNGSPQTITATGTRLTIANHSLTSSLTLTVGGFTSTISKNDSETYDYEQFTSFTITAGSSEPYTYCVEV